MFKYQAFTAPDTIFFIPPVPPSMLRVMASLPVQFEGFAVRKRWTAAVITWTAEQDHGFEVTADYDAVFVFPDLRDQAHTGKFGLRR